MHVEGDEDHAAGWIENVIDPLLAARPSCTREVATGVMLRLMTSQAYCDELLATFEQRSLRSPERARRPALSSTAP